MQCLSPLRIVNPRYKKEGRNPLEFQSNPDYFIFVPCGICLHCIKTWQSSWRARLLAHWKYLPKDKKDRSVFVTFTLEEKYLKKADKDFAPFVKTFRDNFRKKFKRSIQFWAVREYGDNTERLHYHALLFDFPGNRFDLSALWPYGHTNIKKIIPQRISYIVKYTTKNLSNVVFFDKKYKPKCYCSPGIGKAYVDDPLSEEHLRPFEGKYNLTTQGLGARYALPRYLRDKMLNYFDKAKLRADSILHINDLPPPPYRIGSLQYDSIVQFITSLYKDYNKLSPLIDKLISSPYVKKQQT